MIVLRNSAITVLLCCSARFMSAQDIDAHAFSPAMQWRLIGPFRAGRVTTVAGISGQPNVYYFGTPGGGVWKTSDAGRVWQPISPAIPAASIGAIAISPSNPEIIYAGTGEQTPGNGVYKSSDAGKSWTSIGLSTLRFIQAVIVDPQNPDVVIVGANATGVPIGKPPKSTAGIEQGIFKTLDGGKSWQKTYSTENLLGIMDLEVDSDNPKLLYASVCHLDKDSHSTCEIIRSSDQASTWKHLQSSGLPTKARGRIGIAMAPRTQGRRLYAIMNQGFFRSDDAGASWQKSTEDPRIIGSGYFSRIFVDPQNPDVLYVPETSLYRSTDGGRTFAAFKGAPGGDDYHVMWIDPKDSSRMMLGVDQGAVISVDNGKTWTSWYNQPTGQFYRITTDHQFPFWIYGSQQDSGTAAIPSRSDNGEITFRDWFPYGGMEFSYAAPDPLDPDSIYVGGWYSTIVKFNKVTGQVNTVFVPGSKYRVDEMTPLVFSPRDPHTLYLGAQCVLKTTDGGTSWRTISPDLTGYTPPPTKKPEDDETRIPPPNIVSLAPSPLDENEIWAGTNNGLVQVTRDGGVSWQKVLTHPSNEPVQSLRLEASHYDAGTAYVTAAPRLPQPRLGPYIAVTHDFGKTWQTIVNGLPADEWVDVVREDPVRKGLLFAGTETGVFLSFDTGDHWQSLQLNLPMATVTDLSINGADLVASTFGRALWILDDITPLRQMSADIQNSSAAHLFSPATAIRTQWNVNPDTPYPPDEPAGENPPDGAIIDYFLPSPASGEITLDIYDSHAQLVSHFSGNPAMGSLPPANVPEYWFAPEPALSNKPGLNRFVWNLRYPSPDVVPYGYFGKLLDYIEYTMPNAILGKTVRRQPEGPFAVPGEYTLELTVGGQKLRQTLNVSLDPRVHASASDLDAELALEQRIVKGMLESYEAFYRVDALRKDLTALHGKTKSDKELDQAATELEKNIEEVENGSDSVPGLGPVNRSLTRILAASENADTRPADSPKAAVDEDWSALDSDLRKWKEIEDRELAALNKMLQQRHMPPLKAPGTALARQ